MVRGVASMTSLFRRRRSEPPNRRPSPSLDRRQLQRARLSNSDALTCEYRDRRGRICQVAFCAHHGSVIEGVPYCRRHASTLRAIGPLATDPNGRPDVNDRTPSLVNWISRELDAHIRTQLEEAAGEGESVIVG